MELFFSYMPYLVITAFIFTAVESGYYVSFSKVRILRGLPIFHRTIEYNRIEKLNLFSKKLTFTKGEAQLYGESILYFRTYEDRPSFPRIALIPIRITGTIAVENHIKLTARIPVAVITLFLAFISLPIMALIRDGLSPAIVFLVGILLLFGVSFSSQKRKLDNMIDEFTHLLSTGSYQIP